MSKGIGGKAGSGPSSKGIGGQVGSGPSSKGIRGQVGSGPSSKGIRGQVGSGPSSKGIGGQVGSGASSSKGIGGQTGSGPTNHNTNSTPGDCFVATAAFGTPLVSEIQVLRKFRDTTLRRTTFGRKFIALYYTYGPNLAKFICRNEYMMKAVRGLIKGSIIIIKKSQRGE